MRRILFVSSSNLGMSRMAEGLARYADPGLRVSSAGVRIDPADRGVLEDARIAMNEIGARCDGDPVQLTPSLADRYDDIVVLGPVDVSGVIAPDRDIVRWSIDDPAARGVVGLERYRIIRDDLRGRILVMLRRDAA